MTTVLYPGRFQPPHIGHMNALEELVASFDEVVVAISKAHISHTSSDPLTGGERYALISDHCRSARLTNVSIVPIPFDPVGTVWVPTIVSLCPPFDVVYGRNPEITELFAHWSHRIADLDAGRATSGSRVRRLMVEGSADWRALVPLSTHARLAQIGLVDRLRALAVDPNV